MSAITWSAIDRRAPPIGTDEIERGIEQDELFVVYQSQTRLVGSGAEARLEALLRWRHPRWGVLAPGAFMPRAWRAGLATTLTEWLVTSTLRQTRTWRRGGDDVGVSIDLWPTDIHRSLAGTLAAAFSGAPPGAITCEIPEVALDENPAHAANVVAELKWLGVRVAIDGFGISAAAFSHLHGLQLDELKLAPVIIEDLETSAERAAVAITAVACAQALGIEVVACGVRTASDLDAVRALGCDAAEEPAISGPLDAGSAQTWLRARSRDD